MAIAPHLVEQLFGVPPRDFTRARNTLAASLRREGHADDAREVQRLRRPSPTLWATNQLARSEPRRLAAFLDAVTLARRTLLRDPRTAGDAVQRHRTELDGLLERVRALLVGEGAAATHTALQRVAHTLLGAAVDHRFAQDLRHGRLTEELPAPGFEVFAGAVRPAHLRLVKGTSAASGRSREPVGRGAPAGTPRQTLDAERRAQVEQRRARDAERRAQAEQERERRRQDAEEKAREASARQSTVDALSREVKELVSRLAETRRRLRDAQRAARDAAAASRKARRRATP
jgi:hypothetical protein